MKRLLVFVFAVALLGSCGDSKNQEELNNLVEYKGDYGDVTDVEGNKYKTVKIGTQIWMAENLKVKKFRNGDYVSGKKYETFKQSKRNRTPKWFNYGDNEESSIENGLLYNFYAVEDKRGLAPEGWRIPTVEDWNKLEKFLQTNVSYKLRSKSNWLENKGGINSSGFNALPAGILGYKFHSPDYVWKETRIATYDDLYKQKEVYFGNSKFTMFWTNNNSDLDYSDPNCSSYIESGNWAHCFCYDYQSFFDNSKQQLTCGKYNSKTIEKWLGLSVRCIKDI